MGSGKTTRRALPFPLKTDPDTLAADIGALAKSLDNDAETGTVKKHSELPVAKIRGRIWQVTEDEEKGIWWDTGATWITAAQYIAKEAVTSEKIAKEAVTSEKIAKKAVGDEQIATNRALVETGNKYVAFTVAVLGTEYEHSATRNAFVIAGGFTEGKVEWNAPLFIDGVECHSIGGGPNEQNSATVSFILPPGKKWKLTNGAGTPKIGYNYLIL